MALGLISKLEGAVTDDSLPRYYPDAPERLNKGSLALYEPAHPTLPVTGVANGTVIPNLARTPSSQLTGAAESQLGARLFVGGAITGKAIIERSGKGGIHGIVSQDKTKFTTTNDNVQGAAIEFDTAAHPVFVYMKANPTHLFYMSTWMNQTRAGGDKDSAETLNIFPALGASICGASSSNDYFCTSNTAQATSRPGAESLPNILKRSRPIPPNTSLPHSILGPLRRTVGSAAVGTVANIQYAKAATWGHFFNGLNNYPSTKPAYPSYVFYSFYIEDCTVSGRTLEEADVEDLALYIKEVETVGGRYYNDTFTAPATLA